ncbi:MAG: class I SAM-dependent methyltransferase [Rhizomicrobium sp.]
MSVAIRPRDIVSTPREDAEHTVGTAYNQAGEKYVEYADGNPNRLFAFDGQYAYGDRQTWALLDGKLRALRATGATTIRILDLGCGPGTWLRRVVTQALGLGFTTIAARGMDIADAQVRRARGLARDLAAHPGVSLSFGVGDIRERFCEADASVDLCLCLYAVLNHVPRCDLAAVLSEISRVTAGVFIATVRAVGSTPTIFVGPLESARRFRQNNRTDRFDVDLQNGRHASFNSHLFGTSELRALAAPLFAVEDLRGLDLFHGRFANDPRWNPPDATASQGFSAELDRMEDFYCRDPEFIDHATHLLLVARCKARRDAAR